MSISAPGRARQTACSISGTDSANSSDGVVRVAAADEPGQRIPLELGEEDARGGHGKRDHVEKTDSELIDVLNVDYQRRQSGNLEITEFRLAQGSFTSLEQANDLVNRVIEMNKDKVDQVAAGKVKGAKLEQRFDFVTGKEAFRPNGDSDPYIRDTYGVRVIIRHDPRSWRGYRVHTAYPVNDRE
jgi:Bacterial CdiA-CT RNAse A domain